MAWSHGQRSSSVSGTPPRIFSMFAAGWNSPASANRQPSRAASIAPTVVLPLPDTPATMRIIGPECSHGTVSAGRPGPGFRDSEAVESILRVSRGILGGRPVIQGLDVTPDALQKARAMPFMRPRHWLRWLIGAIVVLVVLGVGGPFVYIHFFNGSTPAALSLPAASSSASSSSGAIAPSSTATASTATASTAASASLAGPYSVGSGSVVGYRVNEVLLGQ